MARVKKFTQDRRTQIDFQHWSLIFDQQIEPGSAHSYKSNEGVSSFVKLREKLWEMCGQSEKFTQFRRTQIDFQHCSLIFDQ